MSTRDRLGDRPQLRLIQGGFRAGARPIGPVGPITRLGLWDNFRPLSTKYLLLLFVPKLLLLGTLLYFVFSR